MKTLVFSDTHLGRYDGDKDRFLRELISNYERIIINGDFYDSWSVEFAQFVNNEYPQLISLLKNKETIYILGNHDSIEKVDARLIEDFSIYYGDQYEISIGNELFHFEHGHKFVDTMDNLLYKVYFSLIDLLPKFLRRTLYKFSMLGYRLFPERIGRARVGIKRNRIIKKVKPRDKYYVVGDTHVAEHDKECKFINTGCILGNHTSYITIDSKGAPTLVKAPCIRE